MLKYSQMSALPQTLDALEADLATLRAGGVVLVRDPRTGGYTLHAGPEALAFAEQQVAALRAAITAPRGNLDPSTL